MILCVWPTFAIQRDTCCHYAVCPPVCDAVGYVACDYSDLTAQQKLTKLDTTIHADTRNFLRKFDLLNPTFPKLWSIPQNARWSLLAERLHIARPNLAGRLAVTKRILSGSVTLHSTPLQVMRFLVV